MKKSNTQMKKRLVVQIENHLGWGPGQAWTNKDFQKLSELIFEDTGKQLSVTTLKRVWGRAEPIANPSVTTFDILSEFLGYASWRNFQQSGRNGNLILPKIKVSYRIWQLGLGAAMVLFLVLIFWRGKKEGSERSPEANSSAALEEVSFTFTKVTTGYPNTVIFKYDLGAFRYDSICIQQSWDTSKRIPLNASNGLVTSTYYQPGYYLAKLVADNQILKERDLYIPTSGWQGIVLGREGELSYLNTEVIEEKHNIHVDREVLEKMEELKESTLYLAHLSDAPVIEGDAFKLKTVFRTTDFLENSICGTMNMTITGTREVISLAFSAPGCVGDLSFFIANEMVQGKNHDLSAFGVVEDQWVDCEVVVDAGVLKIFLNGAPVFQRKLRESLGKIGGVQWYFDGLGEIRELTLMDQKHELPLVPVDISD